MNRPSLRAAGLFAIAGTLSGCASFWSWPDIRMVQNTKGLGTGPIADYVGNVSVARSEAGLKAEIAQFMARSIPSKGFSRKDAESLGMQCAPAPSTECTYSGEFWYRFERLPLHSPYYGIRTIDTIQVRLSYLKPRDVVVQVRERNIREE